MPDSRAPVVGDVCGTELHTASGEVVRCLAPLRVSVRNHRDHVAAPVYVCTNPKCGTAKVPPKGAL